MQLSHKHMSFCPHRSFLQKVVPIQVLKQRQNLSCYHPVHFSEMHILESKKLVDGISSPSLKRKETNHIEKNENSV